MKTLLALVLELETKLPFIEQKKETISQATVGWHLEHSLLALVKMVSATEHSNPAEYRWKFNFKRSLVLLLGRIPRGKAKAPAAVKPGETISRETIIPLLEKAKQKVELFEKLNKDHFFTHPVFGAIKLKQARKVIAIHTAHHLAIIQDIVSE